jgi:antibiotic biosynthesis monooxygenase (ABM) superfamily enzyme
MSVGFPTDKGTVDQRVASVAWQLRSTFEQVATIKAWLDTQTDQDLIDRGYTSGEVAVLKSAYTDLDNLGKVAHGQQAQSPANDFFFWAKQLLGVQ